MHMKNAIYPFLFLVIILMPACGNDDNTPSEPLNYGYDYFPDSLGLTRIYTVDSIVLKEGSDNVDTFTYEIKEYFKERITDNEGELNTLVERYYRPNDSADWIINRVFTIKRTTEEAQKNDNNVRVVSLTFPVNTGNVWDGNKYNSRGKQDFEITKIEESNEPFVLSVDVVTVVQKDEKNFIERKYNEERYVRGVGMIFKEHIDIETQSTDTFGVIYRYKIKEYSY